MPFTIGVLELCVTLAIGVPTLVMYARNDHRQRWAFVILACAVLAMVVSPADLLTMLGLLVTFAAVFVCGTRFRTDHLPTAN